MIKKNDERLLKKIGNVAFNDFTKVGDDEDYTIEYDSYAKVTKKATFDDGIYKSIDSIDRVIEPEPFINPHLKSSLIFEYDYTVEGIDYTQETPPFKWEIEYDMKLTDFNPVQGYGFLVDANFGRLNHIALNCTPLGKKLSAPIFEGGDNVLKNTIFDYTSVGEWFKLKYSYEQTNDQLIGVVDFLGIHDEYSIVNSSPDPLNGVKTIYIGGRNYNTSIGSYEFASMYFKNVKVKYNNKLILDCPDPSTGKNLVGVDATPYNIVKR